MIHSNFMVITVSALQFFFDDYILSEDYNVNIVNHYYAVLFLGHHCFYLVPCAPLTCLLSVILIVWMYVFSGSSCVLKWEDPHDSVVYCVDSDRKWMVISGTNRYGVVRYVITSLSYYALWLLWLCSMVP